jgi:hypothetical protein
MRLTEPKKTIDENAQTHWMTGTGRRSSQICTTKQSAPTPKDPNQISYGSWP